MNKLASTLSLIFFCAIIVLGQSAEYTKNTADQTMRSNDRVNPATLGMEFDLPLGSYPTRGMALPLVLTYSSKVWRFEVTQSTQGLSEHPRTWVKGMYSERAAAGWTSSLALPWIEMTGNENLFDQYGRPADNTGTYSKNSKYVRRITVHLPGGSQELRAADEPVALPTPGHSAAGKRVEGTFRSPDGSGMKYVQDSSASPKIYRLYMPDGSYYDFDPSTAWDGYSGRPAIKLTDVNGNYLEYTNVGPYGGWKDQLGRVFPIMIPQWGAPILASDVSEQVDNFAIPGMSQPYTITWQRLSTVFPEGSGHETKYIGDTINGNPSPLPSPWLFESDQAVSTACVSGSDLPDPQTPPASYKLFVLALNNYTEPDGGYQKFDPMVLGKITLPNGAVYQFEYNEYGEIERIKYPTGGHEEFEYEQIASIAGLSTAYQQTNRGVVSRSVVESPSATPLVSTYSEAITDDSYMTTATNPDDTTTVTYMHRGLRPRCDMGSPTDTFTYGGLWWGYDNALAGKVYETRFYNSDSQIVQRTRTRWDFTTTSIGIQVPTSSVLRRNPRIQSTSSTTYNGTNGIAAATAFVYADENGYGSPLNVTIKREYAFEIDSGSLQSWPVPPTADLTTGATLVRTTETDYKTDQPYKDRNLVRLPIEVRVKDGSTVVAKSQMTYDESNYLVSDTVSGTAPGWTDPSSSVRGLVTSSPAWVGGSTWMTTHTQYNQFGSPRQMWDGKNNLSQIEYDDAFTDNINRNTFAFATKIISPVPGGNGSNSTLQSTVSYDYQSGLQKSVTDPNGLITLFEHDAFLRPVSVTPWHDGRAAGAASVTEYGQPDSNGQLPENERFVRVKTEITTSDWKVAESKFDGLGRTKETRQIDAINGDILVDTEYDNFGRVKRVSNPHRVNETVPWTVNDYDTAGRLWKINAPDSNPVTTTYGVVTSGSNPGTVVTVEDQAGKVRRSITNALGQLVRVDEPTAGGLGTAASPNQPTSYTYDLLNNLKTVTQGSQTRTFNYDALSRLTSAVNPESGTISYGYDPNGNLTSKTDARSVTTSYAYDALNRVTQRSYSGESGYTTPTVTYHYDNVTNAKGKLTKMTSSVSTTEYTAFDILGRVTAHKQTTDGMPYTTAYTYGWAGQLLEQEYPSTRVVKNVLDDNGDLSMVQSKKTANGGYWNYAQNFTYNSAGAVTSMQLGSGTWEKTVFNSRLQPTQIALGKTPGSVNLLNLEYEYGKLDPGTGQPIAGTNNGNLAKQKITVGAVGQTPGFVAQQYYLYDELNRLKTASETLTPTGQSGQQWIQDFTYDRYGNRNFNESVTTTLPKNCLDGSTPVVCAADRKIYNPSINTSNNRLSTSDGYSFDAAGNTVEDPQERRFIYDGENKQVKVEHTLQNSPSTVAQYFYDGDGKRVKKVVPGTGETTIFVYDASGKLIEEYSTIVAGPQDAKVAYLTNDHLGSPRINTDRDGDVISRHDYHPFGEEIALHPTYQGRLPVLGYAPDSVRKQFTGYERDNESNLDYAQARMFGYSLGRFTSPDDFLNDTHVSDPQSWNLYVYARNNPLRFVDPTGEDIRKNEDGSVTFDPDKIDKKTGKPKDSEFIYTQKQRDDGSIVTTKWKAAKGTIYSENNGKVVKIEAFKATTAVSVEVQNSFGVIDKKESASLTSALSTADNSADCHGNTFANSEVWINNNQVKKLVENEGYRETTTPQQGDIGLYAEGKNFNLKNVQHSVIVNTVTDGAVTDVISKGGITRRAVLPTGLGGGTAWDPNNNPNDKKNTQLKYFTKRVQQ